MKNEDLLIIIANVGHEKGRFKLSWIIGCKREKSYKMKRLTETEELGTILSILVS